MAICRHAYRGVRPVTLLVVAALAVLALTGCSSDDKDPTTTPTSTTSSPSEPANDTGALTGSDQSSVVLEVPVPPVQGTAKGVLDRRPVTLNVAEVRATPGGTLLVFWYTGRDEMLVRRGEQGWTSFPTLVDVGGRKAYEPLTYVNADGKTACLCTDAAYIRGVPQPRTVYYPSVPTSVSSIEVRQPGFAKSVTVPVTRNR